MPKLVKNGEITTDVWTWVETAESLDQLQGEQLIVPAEFWLQHLNALSQRRDIGVWIDGAAELAPLADFVNQFPLIAIHFPAFMDGRGFSTGRLLRERYQFQGEIRAIGNFMRDQMAYLRRCGFDAFSLNDNIDAEGALKSLNAFSEFYQSAVDQPQPLFRRRG